MDSFRLSRSRSSPQIKRLNCQWLVSLRKLIVEGLERRYTVHARAEGRGFIVEGVKEPARLPTWQAEDRSEGTTASGSSPVSEEAAALQIVMDRMQSELNAIERAGFTRYFLIIGDLVRHGRRKGATCMARGSAPSSLVNFLLGVSNVDPIRHGLIFERLLNPACENPPSLHIDFPDDRIGDILKYVGKKHGDDSFGQLATSDRMGMPSIMGDLEFFGLKALTVIRQTSELVKRNSGITVPLDNLPRDDVKTYELINHGDTVGVFQMEAGRMPQLCCTIKLNSIGGIAALIALNTPGVEEQVPKFIARHRGREKVKHLHSMLEPIARETYGLLIYQEQFLQAVQILAGFSLGEADLLRCAIGKSMFKEIAAGREIFLEGAGLKNNIPAAQANRLFDILIHSLQCSSNKSHAAACAMIAYQAAYLKANHPVEFLRVMLETYRGDQATLGRLLAEAWGRT